jgi:hypothetical protein
MTSVVFDSGASLMYIPSADYTSIFNGIFKNFSGNCSVNAKSGVTYCDCAGSSDTRYPTISISLGKRYTFYLKN